MKTSEKLVFCIMPFREPFIKYYNEVYKPAFIDLGCIVSRSDDLFAPYPIIDDIRASIRKADLLLCELTNRNPNVFYELGLAHAIGKPVILITQKSKDVPFDITMIRYIQYDTSEVNWSGKLSKRIKESALEIFNDTERVYPPPLISKDIEIGLSFPVEKIQNIRWEGLSPSEKEYFYEKFKTLKPSIYKPLYSVVPEHIQNKLNKINPIDLSPFIELLQSFNLDYKNIKLPISFDEYYRIHDLDIPYAEKIINIVNKKITTTQWRSINNYCDYLSCSEHAINNNFVENSDVVILPGTRIGFTYRADEAYKIIAKSGADLIISGNQPYFNDEKDLNISEAEAIEYYLKYIKKVNISDDKIFIENRARNTKETCIHILPRLQEIYLRHKRPLNITIVSSPFHLRRLFFLINKWLSDYPQLVNEIQSSESSTFFDRQIFNSNMYDKETQQFGIKIYLQEYFKLIGGRAVGEF